MKLINGVYTIQGVSVLDICNTFGTPLYVYDAQKITEQVKKLKKAFSGHDIKIKYAAKALTNLSILKHIHQQGCGVDVVSFYEAQLAIKAGFDPREILFTPNCVAFDEIVAGVDQKLIINLDNLSFLEQFGRRYGNTYPCFVRLNPDIMAGGNYKISTGHSGSKFGIPLAQLSQIVDIVKRYRIHVEGLHIHTGSEIATLEPFLKIADILFEAAHQFPALRFIDFGSGFKVSGGNGEKGTDMEALGSALGKAFSTFTKSYGRQLEFWFEPGKYLVSEAGCFFVTTNVIKPTSSVTFAGVDSGLNHFIRPMMYDAYHDIVNVTRTEGESELYTVVGNTCETDTFGADRQIIKITEGDVLAIKNAGAYGYSMASNFNARLRPAEVMVVDGKAKLVRCRDVFEDLLRGQVVEA